MPSRIQYAFKGAADLTWKKTDGNNINIVILNQDTAPATDNIGG